MKLKPLACLASLVLFGCAHNTEEIRDLRREVVYLETKVDSLNVKLDDITSELMAIRAKGPYFGDIKYQMELTDSFDRIMAERSLEADLKSNMHFVQLGIEDYKTTPGREGITPKSIYELWKQGGPIKRLKNPFSGSYLPEDVAVDGWPQEPGQVGYLAPYDSAGTRLGYRIVGMGKKGLLNLILYEGS